MIMTSQSHYKMCLWDDGQFFFIHSESMLHLKMNCFRILIEVVILSSGRQFPTSVDTSCCFILMIFFFWNYWTFFPRFFMNLAFLFLASVDCYGGCWILPALLVFSTSFTINVVATENSITDLIILVVLISLSLHQVGM